MAKPHYPDYSRQKYRDSADPPEVIQHYEIREQVSLGHFEITGLPPSIVGDVDEQGNVTQFGFAQHCEQYVFDHADPNIVYKNEAHSLLGVPITMLPQIRKYHQFPSEDHSLVASFVAMKSHELLTPMFPDESQEFVSAQLEGESEYLALGGYLHDIEKLFADTYRAYDRNQPWNHSAPYNRQEPLIPIWQDFALQEGLGITPETSTRESKRLLINHFLNGEKNLPLGGIISELAPHIDTEKLQQILTVYLEIDEEIIGVWQNPRLSGVPRKGVVDSIIQRIAKKQYDPKILTLACMLVVSDNIAQGIPPEGNSLFPAHQRINLYIATKLISSAYQNAEQVS